MTAEDWAPYGVGTPDADGWYPDYRPVPAELRPDAPEAAPAQQGKVQIDGSVLALVTNWRAVVLDLADRGIDLYDPVVRARSWLGVRTQIFALLESDSRLRAALIRR